MCLSPITIYVNNKYDPQGTRNVQVPCGKCLECKKSYQNSWYVRFYEECNNWPNFIFFTLTYSNDNVPFYVDNESGECYNTVYKEDVQKWVKYVRKTLSRRYGKSLSIKYFITSEYGPRTLRPHYHGIIWGVDYGDFQTIALDYWQKHFGFTTSELLSSPKFSSRADRSLRYVAKYCSKGSFENYLVDEGKVNKTFHLISKGIGKSYVERMKDWHLCISIKDKKKRIETIVSRRFYSIKNYTYALPRYFKSLIYGTKNYLSYQIAQFILQQRDRLYNQKLAFVSTSRRISLYEASNILFFEGLQDFERKNKLLQRTYSNFLSKSRI